MPEHITVNNSGNEKILETTAKSPSEHIRLTRLEYLLCCPKLLTKNGQLISTKESLKQLKRSSCTVGLYLSASWCGACKKFTSDLTKFCANFSNVMREQRMLGKEDCMFDNRTAPSSSSNSFPIIFFSCDKTLNDFVNYYSSMPDCWLAIPFEERVTRRRPIEEFKIQKVPTLLLFDLDTGGCITTNGVSALKDDPHGLLFPWKNYSLPWYKNAWVMAVLRKLPIIIVMLVMTYLQTHKQRQQIVPKPFPRFPDLDRSEL